MLASFASDRLYVRLCPMAGGNFDLRRTEADKPRRCEETRRLHCWIFPVRQPRTREPRWSRCYAFGEARSGSHQRGPFRAQELPVAHVVERHRGESALLTNLTIIILVFHFSLICTMYACIHPLEIASPPSPTKLYNRPSLLTLNTISHECHRGLSQCIFTFHAIRIVAANFHSASLSESFARVK